MREEQGGVYGVSANINLEILPKTTYDHFRKLGLLAREC
jgi:hypothetical protein